MHAMLNVVCLGFKLTMFDSSQVGCNVLQHSVEEIFFQKVMGQLLSFFHEILYHIK